MASTGFSYNRFAIGLIWDLWLRKPLGTGFAFLRPDWIVTAAHVVFEDGVPRDRVAFEVVDHEPLAARVAFRHPTLDIAVLALTESTPCQVALFPSYIGFADPSGLVAVGYKPSKTTTGEGVIERTLEATRIEGFQRELRERTDGIEETILFPHPNVEHGNSGGPVFAFSGGVVGLTTNMYERDGALYARATSILSLLDAIELSDKWLIKEWVPEQDQSPPPEEAATE